MSRASAKAMAARFEFRAQFLVIVNFAVENDHDVAIFDGNRLVARGQDR